MKKITSYFSKLLCISYSQVIDPFGVKCINVLGLVVYANEKRALYVAPAILASDGLLDLDLVLDERTNVKVGIEPRFLVIVLDAVVVEAENKLVHSHAHVGVKTELPRGQIMDQRVSGCRKFTLGILEILGKVHPYVLAAIAGGILAIASVALGNNGRHLVLDLLTEHEVAVGDTVVELDGDHPPLDGAAVVDKVGDLVAGHNARDVPVNESGMLVLDVDGDLITGDDGLELPLLDLEVAFDLGGDEDDLVNKVGETELLLDVV